MLYAIQSQLYKSGFIISSLKDAYNRVTDTASSGNTHFLSRFNKTAFADHPTDQMGRHYLNDKAWPAIIDSINGMFEVHLHLG